MRSKARDSDLKLPMTFKRKFGYRDKSDDEDDAPDLSRRKKDEEDKGIEENDPLDVSSMTID